MGALEFTRPWLLLALPLVLLPLWPGRRHALPFSHLAWLPADRWGRAAGWAQPALAALALLATLLALCDPGLAQTEVPRIGRGAEILLLIDRSRSMDEHMLPDDVRGIDPADLRVVADSRGEVKGHAARRLLARFVAERPDDRFGVMLFSASPMPLVPFTAHDAVVQAGIAAAGVGRGLATTDVGRALLAAVAEFDGRAYTGSRVIVLVSDGGAALTEATRRQVRAAMARNRVALDWIYLRSVNSVRLDGVGSELQSLPELDLHRFFQTLPTPYRAYEAVNPTELERAVADLGQRQNFPLEYRELVPRRALTPQCLATAALACLGLLLLRAFTLRSWSASAAQRSANLNGVA
jgi:mxaC protein